MLKSVSNNVLYHNKKPAFLFFIIVLLASCSLTPKEAPPTTDKVHWDRHAEEVTLIEDWQIKGKIGIRSQNEGGSAYINWEQSRDSFLITLSGPLGQGTSIISGNPGGARLDNSEGSFISDSPEQLIYEYTGWQVPVRYLLYWIKGLATPGMAITNITYNQQGLIKSLQQGPWKLQFDNYKNAMGTVLPYRLKILTNNYKATIVIKSWSKTNLKT